MSIESAIEERIKEAIARGEFDDLKGRGKPIDLDAYFNTPEDLRMAYSILKSNNFVPEEVEMMKEIAVLKEKLDACELKEDREKLRSTLYEKRLALTLLLERRRIR